MGEERRSQLSYSKIHIFHHILRDEKNGMFEERKEVEENVRGRKKRKIKEKET